MGGNGDEKSPDESQVFVRIAAVSVVLALGCGRDSPDDRAAARSDEDDAASSLALHARVDLGVLEQGETVLRRQWLVNRPGAAVHLLPEQLHGIETRLLEVVKHKYGMCSKHPTEAFMSASAKDHWPKPAPKRNNGRLE